MSNQILTMNQRFLAVVCLWLIASVYDLSAFGWQSTGVEFPSVEKIDASIQKFMETTQATAGSVTVSHAGKILY